MWKIRGTRLVRLLGRIDPDRQAFHPGLGSAQWSACCACSEEERKRIEATNPNPRLPLVRFVGGTWRVGGILALSRAFGDAHLKGSLQFEGVRAGGDGYSSGFGVVSEPDTTLTDLTGAFPITSSS